MGNMAKGLFAKKSIQSLIDEASDTRHGLKRTLGAMSLTAMGVGAIIGAGIFVLTGQAAAEYAGPAVTISLVIAALICVFAALCYAEFASMIPISGSAYSYAYASMGEFAAWIIGCSLTLEYLFSAATVAVGWSGYFVSFLKDLGLTIPTQFSSAPFIYDAALGWQESGAILNLPAMFIVAVIGTMIAIGIKAAARLNNIMVVIKMLVIVLFIGCGVAYVNSDNLQPFIPENTGIFGQFGWSGIFRGAGLVFFAFIGFDALSTLAQESRNPQKDLPLGMLGSLAISTIVYILLAIVLTGIVSYKLLFVPDPLAVAVDALGPNFLWLRFVLKVAILAGLTSVVLVMLLGQTRIFYIMSKDGLLPQRFGKIHPKLQTPFFSTVLLTVVCMVVSGLFPVSILGNIVSMGTLLVFGIVCFGVLLLRYTQPNIKRPFKTPFFPWVPALGTLACVAQMVLLPGVTWVQLLGWMVMGTIIYFCYGRTHSRVHTKK
jgi:APA family basic amino acid/polyamine antiporter